MTQLRWFLFGMFVMVAGQALAENWWEPKHQSASETYQQQLDIQTQNAFQNRLMAPPPAPSFGKSPC